MLVFTFSSVAPVALAILSVPAINFYAGFTPSSLEKRWPRPSPWAYASPNPLPMDKTPFEIKIQSGAKTTGKEDKSNPATPEGKDKSGKEPRVHHHTGNPDIIPQLFANYGKQISSTEGTGTITGTTSPGGLGTMARTMSELRKTPDQSQNTVARTMSELQRTPNQSQEGKNGTSEIFGNLTPPQRSSDEQKESKSGPKGVRASFTKMFGKGPARGFGTWLKRAGQQNISPSGSPYRRLALTPGAKDSSKLPTPEGWIAPTLQDKLDREQTIKDEKRKRKPGTPKFDNDEKYQRYLKAMAEGKIPSGDKLKPGSKVFKQLASFQRQNDVHKIVPQAMEKLKIGNRFHTLR